LKKTIYFILIIIIVAAMLLTGCVEKASVPSTQVKAETTAGAENVSFYGVDLRNTISVSAQGEIKLSPDVAYVTAGVVSVNAKLKNAQTDNRTKIDAIYKALADKGITKENIQTASYSVNPQYDYSTSTAKITGYEVTNTIQITVDKIDTVGDILDACSAAGANTAYPITFDLKDKTTAYNDALKKAVETARAKAEVAAKAAGAALGGLMRLDESYSSSSPVYRNDDMYKAAASAEAAPATQITAGELTITANVQIVYEAK
jgi:uncharacterized protein YggE